MLSCEKNNEGNGGSVTNIPVFHLSRSYLIQLEAIEKINTQTLWMSNGQCIPIPKGKYRLLSKAFIAHHFKEAM